jgi:hypothetical protein
MKITHRMAALPALCCASAAAFAQAPASVSTLPAARASAPISELVRSRPAGSLAPEVLQLRMVRLQRDARAATSMTLAGDAGASAVPARPALPAMQRVTTGGTLHNFDGIGVKGGAPANANAAVGETDYVQAVNDQLAIYRKRDGALLLGPFEAGTVFAGFDGSPGASACRQSRRGAPSVHYDRQAQRWIVRLAASDARLHYQCIAVSRTADPAGSYARYALALRGADGAALAPEQANLAIWTDAYYVSAVLFSADGARYLGPRVCGIERGAMLAGTRAAVRCRDLGPAFGPVLPSDLDGKAAPPANSPNYLLALDFDADGRGEHLILWPFSFTRNTLGAPVRIPVTPFTIACPGSIAGHCIEQAGAERLGALGDRLMPRLAYRNFGSHASLVANHSVQQAGAAMDGPVGVRWYELRDPGGRMSVYQQGTHAPDTNSRWMGSLAMDRMGNIALGYSVAGGATPPGVRYTGRLRSEAPGRMELEEFIVNGTGVQLGAGGRWGDRSAMAIDPVDDCTFWYTQQYIASTGQLNWRTRIASFSFSNCKGALASALGPAALGTQ